MKSLFLAFTVAMFVAPAAAGKPMSIVGNWAVPGETCANAIAVGPMSLKSEDVDCRFSSVKRVGHRVTWKGTCDDAEGSSREIVIATEKNGRLTIRYVNGGNVLKDLWRCEP
jgi:hypothetical protein